MAFGLQFNNVNAQEDASIAQFWNEAALAAISRDFARPTVHARNLFHSSIAIYDAWAAYDPNAEPYLLGRTRGTYTSTFSGVAIPDSPEAVQDAREVAISFAAYRLLIHRFQNSPGAFLTTVDLNQRMIDLGLDRFNTSTSYVNGGPAELGNYIAQQIINYGLTDGSNESADYANTYYQPLNSNIFPEQPGAGDVTDPNRWQAISLSVQIDQSGNAVSNPPFLSPEWGNVVPFALHEDDLTVKQRDGHSWNVYFDPGIPPQLDTTSALGFESLYKWNHCMVCVWQSHLDPDVDVMIDVSPANIGNLQSYPTAFEDYVDFYDFENGGVNSPGYTLNPITNQPYETQFVKMGDYARILAEFWADGPQSVTPPGHWFKIYNEIRHNPLWENKWMGQGPDLDQLEYDVKTYLTLGGAMHDAAITAWGIKGYYDIARPVTAIRYMSSKGQCSDPDGLNYHPAGMPLMPGLIEQVLDGDPLAGEENENVGKVKVYTWKGPDYIVDPETSHAGVGWILGENWWPYQRPSFVTPPFAGYISGHSTFSRTAAEVLTLTTGSPFFPGGMSNFVAEQNDFLAFEQGPSETVILQWATYQDASDQCSLSRIWGGIHPPFDDIPGRLIGIELGPQVFNEANNIFETDRPIITSIVSDDTVINIDDIGSVFSATITYDRAMNTAIAPSITFLVNNPLGPAVTVSNVGWISPTEYKIDYLVGNSNLELRNIFMRVTSGVDATGMPQNVYLTDRPFEVDTKKPLVLIVNSDTDLANDQIAQGNGISVTVDLNENCDTSVIPTFAIISASDLSGIVSVNEALSMWADDNSYTLVLNVSDTNEEFDEVGISISDIYDAAGNPLVAVDYTALFDIDTKNPEITSTGVSNDLLNTATVGSQALSITFGFDEEMNTNINPVLVFPDDNPLASTLVPNSFATGWANNNTFTAVFNQISSSEELFNITIELVGFIDQAGNTPEESLLSPLFGIDTKKPTVQGVSPTGIVLNDSEVEDGVFELEVNFEEPMNESQLLLVQLNGPSGLSGSINYNPFASNWLSTQVFKASFNTNDQGVEISNVGLNLTFGLDLAGNTQTPFTESAWINIDTKNPAVNVLLANTYDVHAGNIGVAGFSLLAIFDEAMSQDDIPEYLFDASSDVFEVLTFNGDLSGWVNDFTYQAYYDVAELEIEISDISVSVANSFDAAGNLVVTSIYDDFFSIGITTTSASDHSASGKSSVYPNPFTRADALTLEIAESILSPTIQVWSTEGKMVHQQQWAALQAGKHLISLPQLAEGAYFLNLTAENHKETFKLVVNP